MIAKYRGKRLDNKEWVYGWLYSIVPYGNPHERGYMIKEDMGDDYEVDPNTVGQWTGLTDRNGVEIYQGDFVQEHAAGIHYDPCDYVLKLVEWWACGWMPFMRSIGGIRHDHAVMIRSYVVIGNRHDHPHLLEGTI